MSTKATAARIYEYGEPDVFRFETMDVPDPVGHEVLVRSTVIGLNFVDIYYARVQLLHPWSLEERDRLGLSAPWGQRLVWESSGDHGCVSRRNRNRSGPIPSRKNRSQIHPRLRQRSAQISPPGETCCAVPLSPPRRRLQEHSGS